MEFVALILILVKALGSIFVPIFIAGAAWKAAKEYELRGKHFRGEIKSSAASRAVAALRKEFSNKPH